MKLEEQLVLAQDIQKVYPCLIDFTNTAWRSDLKETKKVDEDHYIEYSKKEYPTFFTVVNRGKNKIYELEFTNTRMDGTLIYRFQKQKEKTLVVLELQCVLQNPPFWWKSTLKRKWKTFLKDLEKSVG